MYAKQKGYKNVRIRTPDSDIFFICLHYAKTKLQGLNVLIDTGNGKNRRLIDVTGYASGLSIERCSAFWDYMLSPDVTLPVVSKELEK